MIDESKKRGILKKILESKEFDGAKTYQKLLLYLAEASFNGHSLKESTIAFEFHGKSGNFNPAEDASVRVHLYNLRRKLRHYYHTEGKRERVRLIIPKGRYEIEFISAKKRKVKFETKALFTTNIFLLCLLFVFGLVIFVLWKNNESIKKSYQVINYDDPIWADFTQTNLENLIVVGDHFFFSEYRKDFNRNRLIRDVQINSKEDLKDFTIQYPDKNTDLEEAPVTYLEKYNALCLADILPIFFSAHKNINFHLMSDLESEDLLHQNIIFAGSFKTIGLLDHYFSHSSFNYQVNPHKIIYKPDDADTVINYTASLGAQSFHTDYAVIAKIPGPKNNVILVITAFHFSGLSQAGQYLTDQYLLNTIENKFLDKYGTVPKFFEILLEVNGIDRIGFYSEIKHFHKINSDINIWGAPRL